MEQNPYSSPGPPPDPPSLPPAFPASNVPIVSTLPRFGLLGLLGFMTGCSALLGVLSAIGITPWGAIIGFIAIPLFCAAVIGVLEVAATLRGER